MQYVPADSGELLVRVLVGEQLDRKYDQSLAGQLDEVHVGLPAEYVRSVLEAICAEANGRLGAGILLVDRGAHGLVGPNANLFGRLARLGVRLLIDPRSQDERLREAFQPGSCGQLC